MAETDIHMGGLISGTDVQGLIDKLLVVRSQPIKTLYTKQEEYEADIAAWSDISGSMGSLTDILDDLRGYDLWNQRTAVSSNEDVLKATATSAAAEATYTIFVSQLAQAHSVSSDRASDLTPGGTESTDLVAAGVLTAGHQFVIEGQTITIGASESISSLQGKINTAASSMAAANRVQATILDHRLVISRANTGATEITMSDMPGGTALADLAIRTGGAWDNELITAQDAQFTVNGAAVTRSANTNLTDVIDEVSLNLYDDSLLPVTLRIEGDREAAKTKILEFIEYYNAAADKMKEYGKAQVEDGEVVTGELQGDSLLRSIQTNIRKYATDSKYPYLNNINAAYTYKGSTGICNSLESIGVWTTGRDNVLSVTDEDKLDYMLENYFDEVEQLFRGVYDPTVGYTHGVASDFYAYSDSVTESLTGSIDQRLQALEDRVDNTETEIKKLEDRLDSYEQELWEMFTSMEESISKMQSDLSYLTSKLNT